MVERYLDTVEVSGSSPLVPTIKIKGLRENLLSPFFDLGAMHHPMKVTILLFFRQTCRELFFRHGFNAE